MAHEYTLSLKPDKKKGSPFQKIALTISANDNNKAGAKGVRSFTPFHNPATAARMFNSFYSNPPARGANTNLPAVRKYLDPK